MCNRKVKKIIVFISYLFDIITFILIMISFKFDSTRTNNYKNFFESVSNNTYYYEYLLINNNYYVIKEDEAKKIIKDFIELDEKKFISYIFRIYTFVGFVILFDIYSFCFLKIKSLNVREKKGKCKLCCFNIIFIIDIIMIIYVIIDSIIMINFRNKKIIPYIKILFANDNNNKFNSRMKTSKNFDIVFIILFLIPLFDIILLEIEVLKKCKNCYYRDNEQHEINANQNFNQRYLYNANYNTNISNRNPQLVYPGRNVATGQYVIVDNHQNSNNLNSLNNSNSNKIENSSINNFNWDNENELNINNNNNIVNINNNNNISYKNNKENNKKIFFKKLLEKSNRDKFNKNWYKNNEDYRICLMKFDYNDNILILPCFHFSF